MRRAAVTATALVLAALAMAGHGPVTHAANPTAEQLYLLPMPEDDILQLFDDNDAAGGTFSDPKSPIRSIFSISIGATGSLVYFDQWEDGSYDTDIANPGANTYDASTNADGTQIWGDGVLANGCPPAINNVPNPCSEASDDELENGDVIVLDNEVAVSGTSPGPYSRSSGQVFFDGKDKVGVSFPVAVTRASFPVSPGSVMAGATEVFDTSRWGTSYVSPLGENSPQGSTSAFEDVRWFIMAGPGGATVSVDANADGDYADANDLAGVALAEGGERVVNGILEGASLSVTSGNPVQVVLSYADVNDTFEFRWSALIPRGDWSTDYYSPVGTQPSAGNGNRGCTEVWIYNPKSGSTSTHNVRDKFTTVAYNNNDGSKLWSNGWTETNDDASPSSGDVLVTGGRLRMGEDNDAYIDRAANTSGYTSAVLSFDFEDSASATAANVRDNFSTQVYTRNDGSANWNGDWTDSQNDGATSGLIQVATSGGGRARFDGGATNYTLTRSANTAGSTYATLSFNLATDNNLEAADVLTLWIATSPSGTFTALDTWSGNASGTETYDIKSWISSDTTIRFGITGETIGRNEYWYIDSVDIDYGDRDEIEVQINDGNPNTWVTLDTIDGSAGAGSRSLNVGAYIATSTAIRFRIVEPLESGDYIYLDNVDLSYSVAVSGDITVYVDQPGGATPDSSVVVPARDANEWPATATNLYGKGMRLYTTTGDPFLPISVTDCTKDTSDTDGRLFDWDNPVFPARQLTSQVLVPFAPGCSGESSLGVCQDSDVSNQFSRNVVWITPIADTTIYVDTNGSGISCPGGSGAEQTISAGALVSYRLDDDPSAAANVRDEFSTAAYSNDDGLLDWGGNWIETGDDGFATTGDIWITNGALRIQAAEAGDAISRGRSLAGQVFSNLTFELASSSNLEAADVLAVDVSADGGTTWRTLATYSDDPTTLVKSIVITDYATGATQIRFRQTSQLDAGEFWAIDDVQIKFAGDGDYDMTGARIRTCNGVAIAAAWGQDPNRSGGNDEEALDMGTTIAPFGSALQIEKSADATMVGQGGLVTYAYQVRTEGAVSVQPVEVIDNRCSPATYVSGDSDADAALDPGETWVFTCPANVYYDTTNVAFARGRTDGGTVIIESATDEWTVSVEADGTIGNIVWSDEDADGVRDAGEPGIPNVLVTLTGTDNRGKAVSLTTYTDANGGYLFNGLVPSNAAGYTVTVTPPVGASQTYDENGLGTPNATKVVLAAGDEHLTADFGYSWAPSGDVDNPPPGATGAIGDRVWIDADADGRQDPGEAGLGAVTVRLYKDGDGDGSYDELVATTTTAADGTYLFDGLPAGGYVVAVNGGSSPIGTTQTGDPDQPGVTCTTCNNASNTIVLAPGDIYLNADFGYQPGGDSSTIGDTVWFDADADGLYETANGEYGIAGVTVSLIDDLDGDGVWDVGEPIIATDTTDAAGNYAFPGLPAGDYIVVVNDTEHVLGDLAPSYDPDGGTANQGAVTVDGIADNLLQDFGYTAPGHTPVDGLIGDTVFLDRDGDNAFDAGEGLEGVTVRLYESDGTTVLATTYTDELGHYSFGGLEPSQTYVVKVDPTTLPNAGAGLTNTVDPDGGSNSQSIVNLATNGPINLLQDFGYRYLTNPNAIAGTIWTDTDADGTLDGGEGARYAGVTVVLRDANGDIVATTSTDANGNYAFPGLPNGTYTVEVTDDDNVLAGTWHSSGTPNTDGQSQTDPLTVTLTGNTNIAYADFGYYRNPAAIGNFVWDDADGDGVQDSGEPGIPGVLVTLTVAYPNGDTVIVTALTDVGGFYSFGNLLLDEDHDGVGAGEPTYSVTVAAPPGYSPGPANQGGDDALDSDPSPLSATVVEGQTDNSYDFGFRRVGSIGDRVWLDANRNGFQEAAENGISGAIVTLYADDGDNVFEPAQDVAVATTVTDGNGEYLFHDVPPGSYWVAVATASLPGGITTTYDEDDGTTSPDGHTAVTLAAGAQHRTADFGYAGSGGSALGDYVWYDRNGDGRQDDGEVGIGGVRVFIDTNQDGDWDAGEPYDITDADGSYLITGLIAATYRVRIDPTTTPSGYSLTNGSAARDIVVPANTDVLWADFGLNGGTVGSIGNTVWLDLDRDGVGPAVVNSDAGGNGDPAQSGGADNGEPAIAGVTVALIRDANADGVWDPDGVDNVPGNSDDEIVIATDVTDANGQYRFSGLPLTDGVGTDDYLVWISDVDNVLAGLAGTYDTDGGTSQTGTTASDVLGLGAVSNLGTTGPGPYGADDARNQDVGYAPPVGVIGNRFWHDLDGDGRFGIPVIDGGLDMNYDGVVNAGDVGKYGAYDVIGGRVDIHKDGVIDGDDDGSVAGLTVIDGRVDADADGVVSADTGDDGRLPEPALEGVTIDLYFDGNNDGDFNDVVDRYLGTQVTDAAGQYYFTGLPPGDYLVDVTDTAGVLGGFAKTTGPSATVDNNSQTEPYDVALTETVRDNYTADFGYVATAGFDLGGTVFHDTDNDGYGTVTTGGVHDAAGDGGATGAWENGIDVRVPFVPVYLYRDLDADGILDTGDALIGTQLTDAYGGYLFEDLPTGTYIVVVDATGTRLDGFSQTTQKGAGQPSPVPQPGVQPVVVSADSPNHDFGFFSQPGGPQTTPVTISYFAATAVADGVRFDWATASETRNVGFNLYAMTGGDLVPVNAQLIPSPSVDHMGPRAYGFDARGATATEFYIEDVDADAVTRLHGPFALGQAYGEPADATPIDWTAIHVEQAALSEPRRAEDRAAAQAVVDAVVAATPAEGSAAEESAATGGGTIDEASDVPVDETADTVARGGTGDAPIQYYTGGPVQHVMDLKVTSDGIYRMTHEDLLAAGLDLTGVRMTDLGIENRGKPIPVNLSSGTRFGTGAWIEFFGQAMDTLYTKANVYTLFTARASVNHMATDARRPNKKAVPAPWYLETSTVNRNRAYQYGAPVGSDAWYDAQMLTYMSPGSWAFQVSADNVVAGGPAPVVTVGLWGITSWPTAPDHHVMVSLNGLAVGEAWFDGQEAPTLAYSLPAGVLVEGANTLALTLPGDSGAKYEVQQLDRYGVTYPRAFAARGGRLTFTATGDVFKVTGMPQASVVVYRLAAGVPHRLTKFEVVREGSTYSVLIPGNMSPTTYLVSAVAALAKPVLAPPRPIVDITSGRADYLIVTHPSFKAELSALVQAREAQGLKVKVADVDDVYRQFSHGIFDASAIGAYVKHAATKLGVRYVLLVGGDTYDYHDYLGRGSVSFVPSPYAKTDGQINFAPVDPLYADLDGDGVQDVAIGRFPVRTVAELRSVIGKTLAYQAKPYRRTAVFASDALDPKVDFRWDADEIARGLPAGWSVVKAHVDDLLVSGAKKALTDAMNGGVALTGFVGHSSATAWTFRGLFRSSDAAALGNAGRPTVVAQWGCWNTYHVEPAYNTLGHTLMLSGDRGAAAVLGASTLTQAASERLLGALVMPALATQGKRMGDAIVDAKKAAAGFDPNMTDVLLGWTLLGDPALVVEP